MRAILGVLRVLVTPSCWIQLNPYVPLWERRCQWILSHDQHFTDISLHTARIDGLLLWTSNHPYSSFHPYPRPDVRPRRITMLRMGDLLRRDGGRIPSALECELEAVIGETTADPSELIH